MASVMCRVCFMLKYFQKLHACVLHVDCHLQSRVCCVLRAVCCLLVFAVFSLKPGARPERLRGGDICVLTRHCTAGAAAAPRANKRRPKVVGSHSPCSYLIIFNIDTKHLAV